MNEGRPGGRSPPMPAWLPTAGICYRSPGRSSARSIPKAATFWQPFPRSTGTILGLPGPRARFGSASIVDAASTRSIPRPARYCTASTPTVSSPVPPGRRRALARYLAGRRQRHPAHRSCHRRGAGMAGDAAGHRRLGTGFRWRRAVLLRRQQRQAEGGSAQAGSGRDLGLRPLPREPGSWHRT